MARLNIDEMRALMSHARNVRNMCVIAHVDHGKSTLTDNLVARSGILSVDKAGETRYTDTMIEEQLMGITIKSTAISLHYKLNETDADWLKSQPDQIDDDHREFLVNLIDSPGHVDFSSEVTAALRVTDGALVVVDCVSGVCVQTETVLRQALAEKVKPILFLNKIDRAMLEQRLDAETLYRKFRSAVTDVNALIATYSDASSELMLDPSAGNVGFGSGRHSWAFTLKEFAEIYARKFGVSERKMMQVMWGEHFYNAKEKKWSSDPTSGKRGFIQYIIEPIQQVMNIVDELDRQTLPLMLDKLNIKLDAEELEADGKSIMKSIMKSWLPAGDAILRMIINHLPSPVSAQKDRCSVLYEGPQDDAAAIGIKSCDAHAELMMYVSKMVPAHNKNRFIAFGRVFSGTVRGGQRVRIQTPNYVPGDSKNQHEKKVQAVVLMMGRVNESISDVPAGNICGLVGIDDCLVKTGTITTFNDAHNMKVMRFSVSPVVRVAVEPVNGADLPKLVEGLKRLAKFDSMVQCIFEATGEHIVCGAGELHLDICLKTLEETHARVPIRRSQPLVKYCETVTRESERCLAKTPNKLNRIWMCARSMSEELVTAIDDSTIGANDEPKARARVLAENFDWDTNEARKIWCFGPDCVGANILVDNTKGVQYLDKIKDSMMAAFQWATKESVICGEESRGVIFSIEDVLLHSDQAHRGGAQILPATRRAVCASILTGGARLLEPVYQVDVVCPESTIGSVYTVLNKRRGVVVNECRAEGLPLYNIKAHLPVAESFGFSTELRSESSGKAFPQCVFSHWQIVNSDPLDVDSVAGRLSTQIRERKGLKAPVLNNYLDRL